VRDFRAGELPAGPQGARGERGPAGPTFGSAAVDDGNTPAPAPDGFTFARYSFALPAAGPTYVRVLLPHHAMSCSSARLGLYIDDAPVPGTDVFFPSYGDSQARELVVIVDLAAGMHHAKAQANCPDGNRTSSSIGGPETWTVLLLGGA
jgi:hypothetical protein